MTNNKSLGITAVWITIAVIFIALATLTIIPALSAVLVSIGASSQIEAHLIYRRKQARLNAEAEMERQKKIAQMERELEIGTENKLNATDAFIEETDRKLNPGEWRSRICNLLLSGGIHGDRCNSKVWCEITPKGDKFEGRCPNCHAHHDMKNPNYDPPIEEQMADLDKKIANIYAVPSHSPEAFWSEFEISPDWENDLVIFRVPAYVPTRIVKITVKGEAYTYTFHPGTSYRWPRKAVELYKEGIGLAGPSPSPGTCTRCHGSIKQMQSGQYYCGCTTYPVGAPPGTPPDVDSLAAYIDQKLLPAPPSPTPWCPQCHNPVAKTIAGQYYCRSCTPAHLQGEPVTVNWDYRGYK